MSGEAASIPGKKESMQPLVINFSDTLTACKPTTKHCMLCTRIKHCIFAAKRLVLPSGFGRNQVFLLTW